MFFQKNRIRIFLEYDYYTSGNVKYWFVPLQDFAEVQVLKIVSSQMQPINFEMIDMTQIASVGFVSINVREVS